MSLVPWLQCCPRWLAALGLGLPPSDSFLPHGGKPLPLHPVLFLLLRHPLPSLFSGASNLLELYKLASDPVAVLSPQLILLDVLQLILG